jgi:hypothetical protein
MEAEQIDKWVWIAKPIGLGGPEYPARPDEIRREVWRAKKVFRSHSPLPLRQTYAAIAAAAASTVQSKMAREFGGGGPNRRYEEERPGPRFFQENPRWRRSEDEDLRRESELRDRAFRERE